MSVKSYDKKNQTEQLNALNVAKKNEAYALEDLKNELSKKFEEEDKYCQR